MVLAARPVNIQASRAVVIQFRGGLLDQPYLILVRRQGSGEIKVDEPDKA